MNATGHGDGARGMMSRALGCTEGRRLPAEFWVQTASWGQPACAQHVAGVIRRAFAEGKSASAVVVDREPAGALCYVAGSVLPPPPPPDAPPGSNRTTQPHD